MANSAKTRIVRNCESPPPSSSFCRRPSEATQITASTPNGKRMNSTLAPYSKNSFGVCAEPPPPPPPGRCAWLASATTASRTVSAIPLSNSLRAPLMSRTLDKHGNGAALGLEDRVLDVPEVLAVDLQRQRPVAGDLDPVEVVPVEQVTRARLAAAGEDVTQQPRQRGWA